MPQLYPMINGVKYDFGSAEILINGLRFQGIKSLGYKQSLKPGKIWGNSSQKKARTRGQHDAEGSMEMYKSDYGDLILFLRTFLGRGYMEQEFDIIASYQEPLQPQLTIDTLRGCRITDDEDSGSEGGDALVVKCELDVMYILRNGVAPTTFFSP